LSLAKQTFDLQNVKGEIIKFKGRNVLKHEWDLNSIPFDSNKIEKTVAEPHYARLSGLDDFEKVTIKVMIIVNSRTLHPILEL
jgi:hypothetical protein